MDLAFTNCCTHIQHGRQMQWDSISSPPIRSRAAPVSQHANVCPGSELLPVIHVRVGAQCSAGSWQQVRARSCATECKAKAWVLSHLDHAMGQKTWDSLCLLLAETPVQSVLSPSLPPSSSSLPVPAVGLKSGKRCQGMESFPGGWETVTGICKARSATA